MKRIILALVTCMLLATVSSAAEEWKNITKKDGLPSDKINFIRQDEEGNVWIGTRKGLALYTDGKIKVRLKGHKIWDMKQIKTGEYWVGINHGLVLMKKDKVVWKGEKKKGKRKGNIAFFSGYTPVPIVHYAGDKYWALGKKGKSQNNAIGQGTPEGWKPLPFFDKKAMVDLYRDSDGTIWAAEDGNGVFEIHPDKELGEAPHHLQGFNVTDMAEDSDGYMWCGVWDRGVRVYQEGQWESHLTQEDTYVFNISEDAQGHIWVATSSSGLWEYDGAEWENHLEDEQINMLATTPDGRVWVSTQRKGGLRYWNGEKWQYALNNRLPFRCVYQTEDGRIWAGAVLGGVFVTK